MTYEYSRGDRLNDRNTYFYTTFQGPEFLSDWERDREQALLHLPAPREYAEPSSIALEFSDNGEFETLDLLEYLKLALEKVDNSNPGNSPLQIQPWLDLLLQRFEVTKRVYTRYGPRFRAAGDRQYSDLALYAGLGEVMDLAYQKTSKLQYLNALLKVIDTLISRLMHLSVSVGGRTARLIQREQQYVQNLTSRTGKARW